MKGRYIFLIVLLVLVIIYPVLTILDYAFVGHIVHKTIFPNMYFDAHLRQKMGNKISQKKTIIFTGLCRNVENVIKKNIRMFEDLGESFLDYRILLFENDSDDKTREIIRDYAFQNEKVILMGCGPIVDCKFSLPLMYDLGWKSKDRIDKMAYFRNLYLSYISEHLNNFDYTLIIDLDIQGIVSLSGLMDTVAYDHPHHHDINWSVIVSNGMCAIPGTWGTMSYMYDSLAYCETANSCGANMAKKCFSQNRRRSQPIWHVFSGFNGCALYKTQQLITKTYHNIHNCEHIGLHSQYEPYTIFCNKNFHVTMGLQGPGIKCMN